MPLDVESSKAQTVGLRQIRGGEHLFPAAAGNEFTAL
ncbi:Uncharacterised protein [Salmonella enterica subsp. enterica]|uniref:Uncharacterized protein n=1 Tax=Salmonella enterica I TaxID=59201 RepID=A0A379WUQ8_SALET|nr:Uncharacterised protein [Salmonella enterica subsp. enterica]